VATLVDVDQMRKDLARLQNAAGKVQEVCRKGSRQLQRTGQLDFVESKRREVYGRVGSLIEEVRGPLKRLEEARRALKEIPTLDPAAPTLIIAGVPNVGKSAFASRVCTAKPEIAPYPFTTQGIILGHAQMAGRTVQVVDTPGILDRPPAERNAIEQRALAAVRHLGDIVLFLFDPTPGASQPREAQERLLEEVRALFGKKLVVEAENKVDLVRADTARLKLSATTGEGVTPLMRHLASVMPGPGGRPGWVNEEE
jgi:nucleolar GTP-binding protein